MSSALVGSRPTTFRVRPQRFAGVVEIALTQSLIDGPYARALASELRFLLGSRPTLLVLNGSSAGFMVEASDAADPSLTGALAEVLEVVLAGDTIIVSVCGGHAVGIGALLLLISDYRIAIAGTDWRLALPELLDGRSMSTATARFVVESVAPQYQRRVMVGERFGPAAAAEAGFIDEFCDIGAVDGRLAQVILRLTAAGSAWRTIHTERLRALTGPAVTPDPTRRTAPPPAGTNSGPAPRATMTPGAASPSPTSPTATRPGQPSAPIRRDGPRGSHDEPAHERTDPAGDGSRRR